MKLKSWDFELELLQLTIIWTQEDAFLSNRKHPTQYITVFT